MPLKGLSFEEIVKKEMDEGKDQKQAVAIAYSVTGKNKKNDGNYLTSKERFHSMEERTRRGTERYAAKPMRYAEDEASAEEHEIEMEELARKRVMNKLAKQLKVGDKVNKDGKEKKIARIGRNPNGTLDVVFEGGGTMFLEPGDDVDTV